MNSKMLGLGSALTILPSIGVAFVLISKSFFANDFVNYATFFVLGVSMGIGVILLLFHLTNRFKA